MTPNVLKTAKIKHIKTYTRAMSLILLYQQWSSNFFYTYFICTGRNSQVKKQQQKNQTLPIQASEPVSHARLLPVIVGQSVFSERHSRLLCSAVDKHSQIHSLTLIGEILERVCSALSLEELKCTNTHNMLLHSWSHTVRINLSVCNITLFLVCVPPSFPLKDFKGRDT